MGRLTYCHKRNPLLDRFQSEEHKNRRRESYSKRSRGHVAASDADSPPGLSEEEEGKDNKMVISMDDDDNTTRDSNNNRDVVLTHYTPSTPPPPPEPPPSIINNNDINDHNKNKTENQTDLSTVMIDMSTMRDPSDSYIGDIEKTINDPHRSLHFCSTTDGESISILILLFRSAYQVNRMYPVSSTILSSIVLTLQSGSVNTDEFVLLLLFRSAYQVHDDNDNNGTIADLHEEDNTIAVVMQLVAL